MDNIERPERVASSLRGNSVQDHIDELPMWADGTRLLSAPMTGMQWLIWSFPWSRKRETHVH
jgi:hypothetical protein